MTEIEIPGWGLVDLNLATCSYRAYRPEMGVALRTSVGMARGFKHEHVFVSELAPYGLLKINDRAVFEPRYVERIASKGVEMMSKLVTLQREHPGETLVILCFEDVHQEGVWCHRQVAAAWFRAQLGLEVPELSTPGDPRPSPGKGARDAIVTRARQAKAEKLTESALQMGFDGLALRQLSAQGWKDLAQLAGARVPSETTIALVVEMVEQRAAIRQALPDDPFEGLAATG